LLPTQDILKSLRSAEESFHVDWRPEEARQLESREAILWHPAIEPRWTWSRLLLQMPREAIQRIQRNVDENGEPLL
jgi:hypothetical protein